MRVYILVEGETEEAFCRSVLQEHLVQFGHDPVIPILVENRSRACSREYKGGVTSYAKIFEHVRRLIRQDSKACTSTMLDLYGLPSDFPSIDSNPNEWDPLARVERLEKDFAESVDEPDRFLPHLMLHEFETLLLVNPDSFVEIVPDDPGVATRIREEIGGLDPEKVNETKEGAPSKRIIRALPQYKSAKTTFGPVLAESIGIEAMRFACPHFAAWLEKIEKLIAR